VLIVSGFVLFAGCVTQRGVLATPPGFARYVDRDLYTIVSPEYVTVRVRTVENDPPQSLEFWAAVCALGVYSGARFSEVLRSGIQSIPRTLIEASVASGLTVAQAYRHVILPIALRLIIPPATSESLNLLKNSSVALTISVAELTFQTRQIETYTAKAIEALTAGTLVYLVLCVTIASIMGWVERRTAIPGLITGGRGESR